MLSALHYSSISSCDYAADLERHCLGRGAYYGSPLIVDDTLAVDLGLHGHEETGHARACLALAGDREDARVRKRRGVKLRSEPGSPPLSRLSAGGRALELGEVELAHLQERGHHGRTPRKLIGFRG